MAERSPLHPKNIIGYLVEIIFFVGIPTVVGLAASLIFYYFLKVMQKMATRQDNEVLEVGQKSSLKGDRWCGRLVGDGDWARDSERHTRC